MLAWANVLVLKFTGRANSMKQTLGLWIGLELSRKMHSNCPSQKTVSGFYCFWFQDLHLKRSKLNFLRLTNKFVRTHWVFKCFRICVWLIPSFCKQACKSRPQSSFKRYALENPYCENFQGCIVVYLSRFREICLISQWPACKSPGHLKCLMDFWLSLQKYGKHTSLSLFSHATAYS